MLLRGDTVIGGVGFAEFDGFPDCCELQKLYLLASEKGQGLGYRMIKYVETQARLLGYRSIYLETHETLSAAIHEYERMGYSEIARPKSVIHTTMNKFYRKDLTNK